MHIPSGNQARLGIGGTSSLNQHLYVNGDIYATGTITPGSSMKLKQDILPLTTVEAIAAFEQLEPVHYRYRVDPAEPHVGFIAEQVPELVAIADRKGVDAIDITAVLTKVAQSHEQRLDGLEARLAVLEGLLVD